MFKTGFILLIFAMAMTALLPPKFNGWERRDWLSTVPFAIGAFLISLSFIVAGWKYLP